jgi:hypothetical protein
VKAYSDAFCNCNADAGCATDAAADAHAAAAAASQAVVTPVNEYPSFGLLSPVNTWCQLAPVVLLSPSPLRKICLARF